MIISILILYFFILTHLFGPIISKIENISFWVSVTIILILSVAVFSIRVWTSENYSYAKLARILSVITVLISLLPFIVGFIEGQINQTFVSKRIQERQLQIYEENKIDVMQRIKENRIYNGEQAILFINFVYNAGIDLKEENFQNALNLMREAITGHVLDLNIKVDFPSAFEGKSACDYYREVVNEDDKRIIRVKQEIRKIMSVTCNYN